jgi:hypothetical protein
LESFETIEARRWAPLLEQTPSPFAVRVLGPPSNPEFQGSKDLFLVSNVYFNRNRSLAIVFVNKWSSPLAASWRWVVFQKTANGVWQEGRNCSLGDA